MRCAHAILFFSFMNLLPLHLRGSSGGYGTGPTVPQIFTMGGCQGFRRKVTSGPDFCRAAQKHVSRRGGGGGNTWDAPCLGHTAIEKKEEVNVTEM